MIPAASLQSNDETGKGVGTAARVRTVFLDYNATTPVDPRVLERLLPEITATVQRLVREEVDRLKDDEHR